MNLISFATNRRSLLGCGLEYTNSNNKTSGAVIVSTVSLMLASAEVERVSLPTGLDIDSLGRLSQAVCSSHTVSTVVLDEPRDQNIIPTLAAALRSATSLRHFKVRNADLSFEMLEALKELGGPKSDIEISLVLCKKAEVPNAKLIKMLGEIHSLRKLHTKDTTHTNVAALREALMKGFPNLQSLALTGAKLGVAEGKVIGESVSKIACRLRTLDLSTNDLCDEGTGAILEGLLRTYSHFREKKGVLRKLDLSRNNMNESGMMKVSQLVKANPQLRQIKMTYNKMGKAGTEFAESLRCCVATLRELRLGSCGLDTREVAAICRSLAGSYVLSLLDLSGNKLSKPEDAMHAISHVLLAGTKSLENLDISYVDLDVYGSKELAQGLSMNSSLKTLRLCGNDYMCTKYLLEPKELNLQELCLKSCHICDASCEFVGGFVARSRCLRKLNMSFNVFHAEGAREICTGVAKSRSLKALILSANDLGDEGAECIAELIIRKNRSVDVLKIVNIKMGSRGEEAIADEVVKVVGTTKLKLIVVSERDYFGLPREFKKANELTKGSIVIRQRR